MKRDIHAVSVKEGKFLYRLARDSAVGGCIVEIGSWKGYSTIQLAKGSQAGLGNQVYAIDPHTGSQIHHQMYGEVNTLRDFRQNIQEARVNDVVTAIVMTSKDAEIAWRTDSLPIALLFIDGDHEDTEADFLRWEPYVVSGGVIAIHDTTTWPSKVPYRAAMKYLYRSDTFRDVRRVGSITYAVKNNKTRLDRILVLDQVRCREVYQLLLPWYNRIKIIGARLLCRL